MRRATLLAAGTMVLTLLGMPAGASAETIKVDTTVDQFDSAAPCSLREAIEAANRNTAFGGCARDDGGSADTVVIRGGETYTRSLAGIEDNNDAGDLDVEGPTTIRVGGDGRAVLVDPQGHEQSGEVDPDLGRAPRCALVKQRGERDGQPTG